MNTETTTNRARAQLGEVFIRVSMDHGAEASYLAQEGWEERLAQYERGLFYFVGVSVVAEVKIPYGSDWIITTVETPGLWGIEDDSGEEYFRTVASEELAVLREMLASLGIAMPYIDVADLDLRHE